MSNPERGVARFKKERKKNAHRSSEREVGISLPCNLETWRKWNSKICALLRPFYSKYPCTVTRCRVKKTVLSFVMFLRYTPAYCTYWVLRLWMKYSNEQAKNISSNTQTYYCSLSDTFQPIIPPEKITMPLCQFCISNTDTSWLLSRS